MSKPPERLMTGLVVGAAAGTIGLLVGWMWAEGRQSASRDKLDQRRKRAGVQDSPIYLDYNATTPIDCAVADAMEPYIRTHFGNPSSSHVYGVEAKRALDNAREQVAMCIGAKREEIVFTSGATESINWALKGIALPMKGTNKKHIITSCIEHPVVLEVCKYLETQGFRVSYLNIDTHGRVLVSELKKMLCEETILVSIMTAHNVTGALQPIRELVECCKQYNKDILFHTDASQALGKMDVNVQALGIDLFTVAGHKIYAPKGVGCLYIRNGTPPLTPLFHGPSQEFGRRAGTENVILAVALGEACAIITKDRETLQTHLRKCRDRLQTEILTRSHFSVRISTHPEFRLSNTLLISFAGVSSRDLLHDLKEDVACSAGAACHSGSSKVDPVLGAMGLDALYANGTLRLSVGRFSTLEEMDTAAIAIVDSVNRLLRRAKKL